MTFGGKSIAKLPRPTQVSSWLQPHPVLGAHQADPLPSLSHAHAWPQPDGDSMGPPSEYFPSNMTNAFSALLSVSGLTIKALKKDDSQQASTEKSFYV